MHVHVCAGPEPAILDWYGHCKLGGSGGLGALLPWENFFKLGTLRSFLGPC